MTAVRTRSTRRGRRSVTPGVLRALVAAAAITALAATTACAAPDGLERGRLSLDGHELRVWVADTAEERSAGLEAVDTLAQDEGMLFVYKKPQVITFGIKGVQYPLDVVFVAEDGRVSRIESLLPADPDRRVSSPTASTYALELPAGWCESNNVRVGSILLVE